MSRTWGAGGNEEDDDPLVGMDSDQLMAHREAQLKGTFYRHVRHLSDCVSEQDAGLDMILASVQRQKAIAGQIGEEADTHLELLDNLDGKVDDSVLQILATYLPLSVFAVRGEVSSTHAMFPHPQSYRVKAATKHVEDVGTLSSMAGGLVSYICGESTSICHNLITRGSNRNEKILDCDWYLGCDLHPCHPSGRLSEISEYSRKSVL